MQFRWRSFSSACCDNKTTRLRPPTNTTTSQLFKLRMDSAKLFNSFSGCLSSLLSASDRLFLCFFFNQFVVPTACASVCLSILIALSFYPPIFLRLIYSIFFCHILNCNYQDFVCISLNSMFL